MIIGFLAFCAPIRSLPVELIRDQTGLARGDAARRGGDRQLRWRPSGACAKSSSGCWRSPSRWAGRRSSSRSIRIPCGCCGRSEAPPPLTWTDRKAELLGELGVDHMIAYPTDEALLQLSAEEFFRQIVRGGWVRRAMVEGPNFSSAAAAAATSSVLTELCERCGRCRFEVVAAGRRSTAIMFPARACGG